MESVILVDEQGRRIGACEKLEAHQKGILHEAFSIFIVNSKNELLLQKRAEGKYHSEGLWSNTCCSHPRPGEVLEAAAVRRLTEEMGLVCELEMLFHFTYKVELENGLKEHEWDYVFIGFCDELPNINKNEVSDFRYISPDALRSELKEYPGAFTSWLKLCFDEVQLKLEEKLN